MTITERVVGDAGGVAVVEYTISAEGGPSCRLMSLGAALSSLRLPDRRGEIGEVTLGYPTAEQFISSGNRAHLGLTVGRFANRIRRGSFTLDGRAFRLACNDGGVNHLHGGERGFGRRVWRGEPFLRGGQGGVRFEYRSADGEEGYPGEVAVLSEYALGEDGSLTMSYEARADSPTVLNLTNHTYWNLAGKGTILEASLQLRSSRYLEVDAELIPTGRLVEVEGSPFDFRRERRIGERIAQTGGGYDHCYVLDGGEAGGAPSLAAVLRDEHSGRTMEVWTTQPGIQFYSGNLLERAGFPLRAALCLETQHYPDSVNHPEFPTTVLRPGEVYRQSTVHRFAVRS